MEQAGVAIEAVIWDFGGVLTTSPFDAAFLAEPAASGHPVRGADVLPLLTRLMESVA